MVLVGGNTSCTAVVSHTIQSSMRLAEFLLVDACGKENLRQRLPVGSLGNWFASILKDTVHIFNPRGLTCHRSLSRICFG